MNEIQRIEQNGIPVLTTQQIAEAYETEPQIITNNFNRNKDRYVEGKHYICLTGDKLREFRAKNQNDVLPNANRFYLWTKKGAFLHAKSLNTDVAWDVYDRLVDSYFDRQQTAISTITPEQIQLFQQQSAELQQLITKLNTRLDELGENAPLTEAEAKQVKTALRKKAGDLCGGWSNMAYHDKGIRIKLYAAMYKALRERFGVRSYKNILHKEFDEAIRLLNEFVPPKFIQTIINNTSSPRVTDLGYVQFGRKR